MTAEIAVLNKNAVALAADSAATLQLPEGPKIYQTNKLFTLSKYHPVGIMLYGNAEFMDVPWEITIKRYRSSLGRRNFARLEDYASGFLDFIQNNSVLFPPDQQEAYCYAICRHWLAQLKAMLKNEVQAKLKVAPSITVRQVRTIFRGIVAASMKHLRMQRKLPRFSRTPSSAILRRHRRAMRDAIKAELQLLSSAVSLRRLEAGCVLAVVRNLYWLNESGIVIAGFGRDENFPHLRTYRINAIIDGKLRVEEVRDKRCDISNRTGDSAALIAFAQSEMVALFMNGIDDDYRDFVEGFIAESLQKGYPSLLSKILNAYVSPIRQGALLKQLRSIGDKLTSTLRSTLRHYAHTMHSDPIVEIVNHLPTHEIAAMAEALVNLTSFKRHVTRQAETVGGPIDVAVITRGDGFIWIKRKQYFTTGLNPHFISNYFNDEQASARRRRP